VSTAHRLVRALARGGLVEQDAVTERYYLGLGCIELGQNAARHFGLERAEAELRDLAAATGEAASLGSRDGDDVVVLARAPSPQPLRFDRPPGTPSIDSRRWWWRPRPGSPPPSPSDPCLCQELSRNPGQSMPEAGTVPRQRPVVTTARGGRPPRTGAGPV
jgi:hypothetical protein